MRQVSSRGPDPLALARRWRTDAGATAAIEFALIAPAMVMLMALIVFAGEGFEVQRKVTMTLRTLTDLVTQQCDVGPTAPVYGSPCPSSTYTYSQVVSAACLVMVPYVTQTSPCTDPALSFTIAEIQTNGSASGSGSQTWCELYNGGASSCPGGSFPSTLSTSAYVVYGAVQYTYTPLGIWFQSVTVNFSDAIYLLPRIQPTGASAPSVACTGC